MKVELKFLAGYLPYGLKIMVHDDFEMEMSHKRIQDNFEDDLKYISVEGVLEDFHCKPILRPLSDLTKEIEHNGEKFVPFKKLQSEGFYIGEDWLDGNISDISNSSYECVLFLLEWHFDLHNLIEKGLAIDINTLNQCEKE